MADRERVVSSNGQIAGIHRTERLSYRSTGEEGSAAKLMRAELTFQRACEQIIHLNRRLDDMSKRYDKASKENHRSFRYSLRLRMAVTEGVRNMYYEYAATKADEISTMRSQLHTENVSDENRYEGDNANGGHEAPMIMDTDASSEHEDTSTESSTESSNESSNESSETTSEETGAPLVPETPYVYEEEDEQEGEDRDNISDDSLDIAENV